MSLRIPFVVLGIPLISFMSFLTDSIDLAKEPIDFLQDSVTLISSGLSMIS